MTEHTAGDRRLDSYLTRKAQARLDSRALVYELPSGRWILERPGLERTDLGENFGRAKEALQLLVAARRAETTMLGGSMNTLRTGQRYRLHTFGAGEESEVEVTSLEQNPCTVIFQRVGQPNDSSHRLSCSKFLETYQLVG